MGPTPTPTPTRTVGMRLSCNSVNVYTIVYHAQYTYTCTRAQPQRTSSRGKARVGQESADFVSELNGPRAPRQADFRARIRAEVGEEVRVGVGVGIRVGPVEFKLYYSLSIHVSRWSAWRVATCRQQVVRVGIVEFSERHDKRTNGQQYYRS